MTFTFANDLFLYSFIRKTTAVMYTVNNYTCMWKRLKLNNKILNILHDRLLTHQRHLSTCITKNHYFRQLPENFHVIIFSQVEFVNYKEKRTL